MWCGAGEGGSSSSGKGTMEKKEEGGERKVKKLTRLFFFSSRDCVSPLRLRISFLLLRSSRSPPRASTPQSPSASPLPPTTRNYAFCRHSRHGLGPRPGPPLRRSCHRRRRPSPVISAAARRSSVKTSAVKEVIMPALSSTMTEGKVRSVGADWSCWEEGEGPLSERASERGEIYVPLFSSSSSPAPPSLVSGQ